MWEGGLTLVTAIPEGSYSESIIQTSSVGASGGGGEDSSTKVVVSGVGENTAWRQ